MPPPPHSGSTIVLMENADGISARVWHWTNVPDGMPLPKGVSGFESLVFNAGFDVYAHRTVATRTALKTAFAQFIDANFPDTPA